MRVAASTPVSIGGDLEIGYDEGREPRHGFAGGFGPGLVERRLQARREVVEVRLGILDGDVAPPDE